MVVVRRQIARMDCWRLKNRRGPGTHADQRTDQPTKVVAPEEA